jgi:UDP-glucose:(heptosyl)LPS alpha-1,3-glucosyltransferase
VRIALTYPDIRLSGGIERVVVECATHLYGASHEVHLLASRVEPGVLPEGIALHAVPSRRRPAGLAMVQYRRRATAELARLGERIDVHASFGAQSPGGGVYWVPSVHRAALDVILGRRTGAARLVQALNPDHLVRLRLEERHYRTRSYATLIASSETVRNDLVRYYDVPPEDIHLLPLGFRDEEFSASRRSRLRPEARASLGLGDSTRVVLFVANELERKGFGPLLEALSRLHDPDVKLLVVGNVSAGPYQETIERLGLGSRVEFLGPSADVGFVHAAADVFALPTLYEPWGLVIVEALASGLPVVTTALAGASVAIQPGVTGEVLDDPEDAARLAELLGALLNGAAVDAETISKSVEHLSWRRVLERYERILGGAAGLNAA